MRTLFRLLVQLAISKYYWIIYVVYGICLAVVAAIVVFLPSTSSYVLGIATSLVFVIGQIAERRGSKKIDAAIKQAEIEIAKRKKGGYNCL